MNFVELERVQLSATLNPSCVVAFLFKNVPKVCDSRVVCYYALSPSVNKQRSSLVFIHKTVPLDELCLMNTSTLRQSRICYLDHKHPTKGIILVSAWRAKEKTMDPTLLAYRPHGIPNFLYRLPSIGGDGHHKKKLFDRIYCIRSVPRCSSNRVQQGDENRPKEIAPGWKKSDCSRRFVRLLLAFRYSESIHRTSPPCWCPADAKYKLHCARSAVLFWCPRRRTGGISLTRHTDPNWVLYKQNI